MNITGVAIYDERTEGDTFFFKIRARIEPTSGNCQIITREAYLLKDDDTVIDGPYPMSLDTSLGSHWYTTAEESVFEVVAPGDLVKGKVEAQEECCATSPSQDASSSSVPVPDEAPIPPPDPMRKWAKKGAKGKLQRKSADYGDYDDDWNWGW